MATPHRDRHTEGDDAFDAVVGDLDAGKVAGSSPITRPVAGRAPPPHLLSTQLVASDADQVEA